MMPMVFCASLPPWPSEIAEAAANCSHWKVLSTARGLARTKAQETANTKNSAKKKPSSGDNTMKTLVVSKPGHTIEARPALVTPAPTRPPISACELDDGMPPHQVMRFQEMAPISAA